MEITILAFGQIAEIVGLHSWKVSGVGDTDALRKKLEKEFPLLKNINYLVAIDKTITQNNSAFHEEATVALLPPYAGG